MLQETWEVCILCVAMAQPNYAQLAQNLQVIAGEVALIPNAGPGLAAIIQQQTAAIQQLTTAVQNMETRLNMIGRLSARTANRYVAGPETLNEVPTVNGNIPAQLFPMTPNEVWQLADAPLTQALAAYGLPTAGSQEATRMRLAAELGMNVGNA